jgi:predicted AAA+ superfamily ATPase
MLDRPHYINQLEVGLSRSPIVALLGPRQVGKTTLAQSFATGKSATFFDLESEPDRQQLSNPELVLGALEGLVVIDEIQVMPQLFNVLRVLVDRSDKASYLILGSASPDLIRHTSQTLAGRVEFIELPGFSLEEVGLEPWRKLWVRGGFPRSFLAVTESNSTSWREGFIRTFLERDIPQLGIGIPAPAMRRFWTMLAHAHGQIWNASELARSMGLSGKTVRSYLDILTGTFMVRQLQPWFANIGKRQVKAPKVYLRDSGLLHHLLGLSNERDLFGHPGVGASWEGFALEEVLKIVPSHDAYYWATYAGAELDLMFTHRGQRFGVEMKFSEAPKPTKSMYIARSDLELRHLWVLHPGQNTYPMEEDMTMLSISDVSSLPDRLGAFD